VNATRASPSPGQSPVGQPPSDEIDLDGTYIFPLGSGGTTSPLPFTSTNVPILPLGTYSPMTLGVHRGGSGTPPAWATELPMSTTFTGITITPR
jgi:hypothetical protein